MFFFLMAPQLSRHSQCTLQTHDMMSEHNFSKKSIICTQQMTRAAKKVLRSLSGKNPGFSSMSPFSLPPASLFPLMHTPECLAQHPRPLFLTAHPSGRISVSSSLSQQLCRASRMLLSKAEQISTIRSRLGQRALDFLRLGSRIISAE